MSSTSNTSIPSGCPGWPCRRALGDPEAPLLALDHQLQAFGPAGNHPVDGKRRRLAACDRAVEHLSVRRPTRVVHRHAIRRTRMPRTGSRLEHLRRETRGGLDRPRGRASHIRWSRHRCGSAAAGASNGSGQNRQNEQKHSRFRHRHLEERARSIIQGADTQPLSVPEGREIISL